ncbi:beta-galactosidase [Rhodococcus sp. X156]|uniref:beta-galactosidase n=1 Tax=Rhodococcus sp. X156 TaxID=2499145 RepID=UPI000FD6C922|nr:beta-galactosidase [Rhodococcus sp. X156]
MTAPAGRRVRRPGLAVCALAVVLTVLGCSAPEGPGPLSAPVSATTPDGRTLVDPAPTARERPPVGMSSGAPFSYLSNTELNRELDIARDLGATWMRIDVDWAEIEPTQGRFDWTNIDRVVRAVRGHGLQVLGILTYTPYWAQDPASSHDSTHVRPANPELFGAFAGEAARHFGGDVAAWEIWNEPNLEEFFLPRPDVQAYTQLLRASHRAIHAATPGATVLGGSLAPAENLPDGSAVAPTTFLEQMYAAGAKNFMDAVSVHPYSFPAQPSDPATADWNTFYRLRYMRATMLRFDDAAKQVWLTEYGAPTGTVRAGENLVRIDERQQAAIIAEGLRYAGELGYVGPVFLYSIRDEDTGHRESVRNFGLVRTDFTRKAAYTVVQEYTRPR